MESVRQRSAIIPKYLTIDVEQETYGIPILKVKEIVASRDVTPLPGTPPSVRGVISLRGAILPVVDLRVKFGLPPKAFDKRTSIVILDLTWEGEALALGVIVDAVREVQAIPGDKVSQWTGLELQVSSSYVLGVADTPAGLRILIDVERILTEDEMAAIGEPQQKGATAPTKD